jgi:hypothetical protein
MSVTAADVGTMCPKVLPRGWSMRAIAQSDVGSRPYQTWRRPAEAKTVPPE